MTLISQCQNLKVALWGNQLLLLFHTKAVKTCVFYLKAVSNVMHCYDDKDDFGLALRVALAEVQRGS